MSITTKIRRQGPAAVITIPDNVLNLMKTDIGGQLALAVVNGELIASPVGKPSRTYSEPPAGLKLAKDSRILAALRRSPLVGAELDVLREKDNGRQTNL